MTTRKTITGLLQITFAAGAVACGPSTLAKSSLALGVIGHARYVEVRSLYAEVEAHAVDVNAPDVEVRGPKFELWCPEAIGFEQVSAIGTLVYAEQDRHVPLFNPAADRIELPVSPMCGYFDCESPEASESSFHVFREQHYIDRTLHPMTAAFIGPNLIITAKHGIREDLERNFFIMDASNEAPCQTHGTIRDNPGIEDTVSIARARVLVVDELIRGEFPLSGFDWAIARVRPLGAERDEIPKHDVLDIASEAPREGARVWVPSHPRGLPLKVADGIVLDPGDADSPMRAAFDVAGGSSGSPILLVEDGQLTIVGITNAGRADHEFSEGRTRERICTLAQIMSGDLSCRPARATPITRIHHLCPELRTKGSCP